MIRWLLIAAACAASFASGVAQARPGPDSNYNRSIASSGCTASFVLDGSVVGNTSSGTTAVSLTTSNGCGVIIVFGLTTSATSAVPTATGLTFTQRATVNNGSDYVFEWTAPYTSNFNGSISETNSGSYTTLIAFGASGVKDSGSYFDPNLGSAVTGTTSPLVLTTTNADDFIVVAFGNTQTAPVSPLTQIQNATTFLSVGYEIVSTTQTAAPLGIGVSTNVPGIADAVIQGP